MTDPNAPGWGDTGGEWGEQQPGSGNQPPPGYGGQQQPGYGGQPPPGYGGQQPGWGPPPPGYGYGQPPGFGAPPGWGGPGYYGAPPTEGKAIGALVCAIGSWVACPIVLAIIALVLASQSSTAIRESGGRLTGEGMNTAARIIAWLNIAILGIFVLFFLFAGLASVSTVSEF